MICLMLKPSQSFFLHQYKSKEHFLQKKSILRKKGSGGLKEKKWKEGFLTALATAIKKDPSTSIKKHTNDLKVHEKTVRTATKPDLSPDLNSLVYAIWGILENKTNVASHPNIGSLKTAVEKEWNKMYEEFILKVCKSLWNSNWKKWWLYWVNLLFCIYLLILLFIY